MPYWWFYFHFCDDWYVTSTCSKVASSKYRKLDSRKHSKPAAPKPQKHRRAQERPPSGSSGEESGSETEQRPPTPTKCESSVKFCTNFAINTNQWPDYLVPIVAVGDNMFPVIEREFPYIHVSPSTVCRLRQKQLQQVTALTRPNIGQKTGTVKKMAEMEQKQKALLQIIKKELDHTKRLVSDTNLNCF